MKSIYLDSAATTKPKQEIIDAMMPYLTEQWYNPSSLYSYGTRVKNDIENARDTIGAFIGASSDEIYFVSSGSEANCWAIQGFVNNSVIDYTTPFIVTTKIEHHSIIECVKAMHKLGSYAEFVDVDKCGFVNENQLIDILEWGNAHVVYGNNVLVSVQFANNEIGSIQDIKSISELVHKYNGILHVDATQALGHIPIDVNELGIDMLTASGHKINAPKGIGILYKRNGIDITPIIYGNQERSLRGGTENVAGIMGMAKAVELAKDNVKNNMKLSYVRNYFIDRLKSTGCKLNGEMIHRLPNNVNIMFPEGVGGEEILYMLDLGGIQCGTGSACNSRSKEPSHVLKAIGLSDEECARSVRFTISSDITIDDIDSVIDEISKAIKVIC